jgi:hypothetical protein
MKNNNDKNNNTRSDLLQIIVIISILINIICLGTLVQPVGFVFIKMFLWYYLTNFTIDFMIAN